MKSNSQPSAANQGKKASGQDDDWDDDVRQPREQPEIDSFSSCAATFPSAGSTELASYHGVNSDGRYKLIINGRRALVSGYRFIVVDRNRDGRSQPWRTYNDNDWRRNPTRP